MEDNLTGFLAASSILTGVQFYFAQVWGRVAGEYESRGDRTTTASVGMVFAYLGGLACLSAVVIIITASVRGETEVPSIGVGMLLFGIVSAMLQVAQPIYSLSLRLREKEFRGPAKLFVNILDVDWVRTLVVWGAMIGAGAIVALTLVASLA